MDSDGSDDGIEGVVMMDMVPQDSEEDFSGSSEVSIYINMWDMWDTFQVLDFEFHFLQINFKNILL